MTLKAFIKKAAERLNLELSMGESGHCRYIDFFFLSNNEILPRMHNWVYGWYCMLGFLCAEDQSYLEVVPTVCQ